MTVWSERTGIPVGAVVPVETVYRLGHEWYSDRFDPDWERPSADDVEATFTRLGLGGPFWSLKN